MEKKAKNKRAKGRPKAKAGMDSVLYAMQQQLNAIEHKLDDLLKSPQGHRRTGQGFDPVQRTYTKAVCSECHKECEIPFKPSGDRPVYCSECFSRQRKVNEEAPGYRKSSPKRTFSKENSSFKNKRNLKKGKPSFRGKKTGAKKRS